MNPQHRAGRRSPPGRYRDPVAQLAWDQVDRGRFWLPEAALSLYGIGAFSMLPAARHRSLSHFEFLRLLQAGLWLEGIFMERLARAVRRGCGAPDQQTFHLREIREEAGHSLMFLEFIRHAGLQLPPSPFPRLRLAALVGRFAPFEHVGFWLAVLMGEAIPDRINRFVRRQSAELCPVAAALMQIHIADEAHHIAHARSELVRLMPGLPRWQAPLLRGLFYRVLRQFVATLFYPEPELYRAAGLEDPSRWSRLARDNPQRCRFVGDIVSPVLKPFADSGLALKWG